MAFKQGEVYRCPDWEERRINKMVLNVLLMLVITVSPIFGTSDLILAAETSAQPSAQEIVIRVDGASCPFCAFGLEKKLGQIEGVASVRLEMKDGEVVVTLKKGAKVSEQKLRQAVEEAGFTPREIIFPAKP